MFSRNYNICLPFLQKTRKIQTRNVKRHNMEHKTRFLHDNMDYIQGTERQLRNTGIYNWGTNWPHPPGVSNMIQDKKWKQWRYAAIRGIFFIVDIIIYLLRGVKLFHIWILFTRVKGLPSKPSMKKRTEMTKFEKSLNDNSGGQYVFVHIERGQTRFPNPKYIPNFCHNNEFINPLDFIDCIRG